MRCDHFIVVTQLVFLFFSICFFERQILSLTFVDSRMELEKKPPLLVLNLAFLLRALEKPCASPPHLVLALIPTTKLDFLLSKFKCDGIRHKPITAFSSLSPVHTNHVRLRPFYFVLHPQHKLIVIDTHTHFIAHFYAHPQPRCPASCQTLLLRSHNPFCHRCASDCAKCCHNMLTTMSTWSTVLRPYLHISSMLRLSSLCSEMSLSSSVCCCCSLLRSSSLHTFEFSSV